MILITIRRITLQHQATLIFTRGAMGAALNLLPVIPRRFVGSFNASDYNKVGLNYP
jgi:hypothetical protein